MRCTGLPGAGQKHGFDLVHRLAVVEVAQLVEQLGLVVGVHHVGQGAGGQLGVGVAQLFLPGLVHKQEAVVGAQVLHQVLGVVEEVLQVGAVAGQGGAGQACWSGSCAHHPDAGHGAGRVAREARAPVHLARAARPGSAACARSGGQGFVGQCYSR